MISALIALVKKDLRMFLGDRRAVIISFVVPLALASLMGMVFGGSGDTQQARIRIAVVDLDGSDVSRETLQALSSDASLEVASAPLEEARAQVRAGKLPVAVVIPQGFGKQAQDAFFSGKEKPQVGLLYDPSHSAELGMVRGFLTQDVMQTVSRRVFSAQAGPKVVSDALDRIRTSNMAPDEKESLKDLLGSVQRWQKTQADKPADATAGKSDGFGISLPYTTHEEALTAGSGQSYNAYSHSFGGMGVQFVLFAGIEAAMGILLERQRGLWRRLRAAPLSRGTLLGAKAISGTVIGFAVMIALFLAGMLIFHIRIAGSLAGFLLINLAFALMASTFGLLIAAVGKSPQASRGIAIFAVLIMVMLGGAWFPAFLFPPFLQKLTLIMPTRWAVDGLDATTWRGLGFSAAIAPTAVLVGSAILFGGIALSRFRWDVD